MSLCSPCCGDSVLWRDPEGDVCLDAATLCWWEQGPVWKASSCHLPDEWTEWWIDVCGRQRLILKKVRVW